MEQKYTTRRFVEWLFFGTYFGLFLVLMIWFLVLNGSQAGFSGVFVTLIMGFFGAVAFPCGLFGLISHYKNYLVLGIFGYVVYVVLYLFALSYRKYWQTVLLWAILVLLLIFNMAGCEQQFAVGWADP